ncbi:VWA domain-containing protein [candidate division KSB1 bacterium]|nr:VWA domain-containing protein [candidate division KSB1 bacterium]
MKPRFWAVIPLTLLFLLRLNIGFAGGTNVAVLNFKINHATDELDYLGEGIAEMIITDISGVSGINVVERERLGKALEELELGQTGLIEDNQALSVGEMIGADLLILGSLTTGGKKVRLDAHILEVKSGSIIHAEKVFGSKIEGIFDMVDQLTTRLIADLMGVEITEAGTSPQSPHIDVVFILDSTGSMGDEISAVKERIRTMVDDIRQGIPPPVVRYGMVDYKDRGDPYIVKKFRLTEDVQAFINHLNGIAASGGGDDPESVNEALHEAIWSMDWDLRPGVSKIAFLIGDAPPHMDYRDDYDYRKEMEEANKRHISIHTIACSGISQEGVDVYKYVSGKTNGNFAFLTYREVYLTDAGKEKPVYYEGDRVYIAAEEDRVAEKTSDDFFLSKAKAFSGEKHPASKPSTRVVEETDVRSSRDKLSGLTKKRGTAKENNLDLILRETIKSTAKNKGVVYKPKPKREEIKRKITPKPVEKPAEKPSPKTDKKPPSGKSKPPVKSRR